MFVAWTCTERRCRHHMAGGGPGDSDLQNERWRITCLCAGWPIQASGRWKFAVEINCQIYGSASILLVVSYIYYKIARHVRNPSPGDLCNTGTLTNLYETWLEALLPILYLRVRIIPAPMALSWTWDHSKSEARHWSPKTLPETIDGVNSFMRPT